MDEVVFGRYRLISVIGQGGMGTVYRAHDTEIGRDVAVKVLSAELGGEPGYRERFRREAYAAARLAEPHVIPIYDTGEIEHQLYLVMPIVEGTDVHELLAREGPMRPERAVHIIEQLAAALSAAHAVGLVHRDIKPSNALVTGRDFVYLIDFGIAHDAAATKLTRTGMIVGTMAYMAPERFTAGVADARSDVYALACVLYECLTGDTPFPGASMEQQMAGHLMMDPPRPSEHRSDVPAAFDEVIAGGMAKAPEQRYQSAHELAVAAHDALTTLPSRPAPKTPAVQTRIDDQPPSPLPTAPRQQQPVHREPATSPSRPSPPVPARQSQRRRGPIALVILAVTILAAGIIGITGYLSRSDPQGSGSPAAASGPKIPQVAETALTGLLLSPDQLGTAMGATGMTVTGTISTLPDGSGMVPDKACVPLEGPGQAPVYAGTGWTAVSGQRLADQNRARIVQQIVVLFSSAQEAKAFFTASAQRWPACSNRQHDEVISPGQTQVHTVGPVSDTNGTLSATITGILARNGASGVCERALTVANNVAIDIDTCAQNPSGAAVNIADQIAAKVPTR